jgi:hypothetical protein
MTGTNPAHDTRFSSSNRAAARDHSCNNLTESAFRLYAIRELQQPSSSQVRRHFPRQPAAQIDHSSVDPGLEVALGGGPLG